MAVALFRAPVPLTDLDVVKSELGRLKDYLSKIQSGAHEQNIYEALVSSLKTVDEFVECRDYAEDFEQMGGFDILPQLLSVNNGEVKAKSAEFVANLAQHCQDCRTKLLEASVGEAIMNILKNESDDYINEKAMYALSSIFRNNKNVSKVLLELQALPVLIRFMSKPGGKLRTKTTFLMSCLAKESDIRAMLIQEKFIPQLVVFLKEDRSMLNEYILSILLNLATHNETARQQCQEESDLQNLLLEKCAYYEGKEEFLEAKNYAVKLEKHCFENKAD